MTDSHGYVIQRVLYAIDMVALLQLKGDDETEFIQRHYYATIHGLAALGHTNSEIDRILRDVESKWARVKRDNTIAWPYPSRIPKKASAENGGVDHGS